MGTSPAQSQRRNLESCVTAVEDLLRRIVQHSRFDLSFAVKKAPPAADATDSPAYIVDFSGPDQDLLLEKNAALLDALESVVLKAIRLEEDLFGKITFDCRGWRQLRVEELKLMARVAAERVIETGDPFTLNPMSARAAHRSPRLERPAEGVHAKRRLWHGAQSGDRSCRKVSSLQFIVDSSKPRFICLQVPRASAAPCGGQLRSSHQSLRPGWPASGGPVTHHWTPEFCHSTAKNDRSPELC